MRNDNDHLTIMAIGFLLLVIMILDFAIRIQRNMDNSVTRYTPTLVGGPHIETGVIEPYRVEMVEDPNGDYVKYEE